MNKEIKKILIIAAEPSGDILGAEFIEEIRKINPNVDIKGIGLDNMAKLGINSIVDMGGLAIIGLAEALGAWKKVANRVQQISDFVKIYQPDVAILIDSWGFNIRAGKAIAAASPYTRLIKMIGPQVWASRPGRAKVLSQVFDELWCIFDFELPFYQGLKIKTNVIGNPAMGRAFIGNGDDFKARHNLSEKRIIGLLPGSRRKEILKIAPSFIEAAQKLANQKENLIFVTVAASAVKQQILESFPEAKFDWLIVDEDEKANAFAAMEMAMACSGTVTTELGLAGVPFVVGYRLDNLTFFIAKNFMVKSKYVTLINVAADEEIAPEFLQGRLTPTNIENYVLELLLNEDKRKLQIQKQSNALDRMGRGQERAALRAAKLLFDKV
jgi:lipid-A-disaccharide synthase